MTSIPRRPPRPKMGARQRRMSAQELVDEWKQEEDLLGSSLSRSPTLDFLLSAPDEDEILTRTQSYTSFSSEIAVSESAASLPSLDTDERSYTSWRSLTTPELRADSLRDRKPQPSLTQGEECFQDHPLLFQPQINESDEESIPSVSTPKSRRTPSGSPPPASRLSTSRFRSNLSASLSALRSAARSFSNFTTSSTVILPDDHISRGLFNSPVVLAYRPEMRPKPIHGTPSPELRRYLNPSIHADFHVHGNGPHVDHAHLDVYSDDDEDDDEADDTGNASNKKIIKMRTYSSTPSASLDTPSGDISPDLVNISPAAEASHVRGLGIRQREPRENGEFLRMCVLEMAMRRAGKLDEGKAKWWLPPRVVEERALVVGEIGQELDEKRRVPVRWQSWSVEY